MLRGLVVMVVCSLLSCSFAMSSVVGCWRVGWLTVAAAVMVLMYDTAHRRNMMVIEMEALGENNWW